MSDQYEGYSTCYLSVEALQFTGSAGLEFVQRRASTPKSQRLKTLGKTVLIRRSKRRVVDSAMDGTPGLRRDDLTIAQIRSRYSKPDRIVSDKS